MPDDFPKVSILMSVLNTQDYIRKSAESIFAQTLTDFELIIIDDGSTDNTWMIICELADQDPRVIPLRNETNTGTSNALNKGLLLAKGEYITRQDGDDFSAPRRLESQVHFLDQNLDTDVVGTAVVMVGQDGNPMSTSFTLDKSEDIHLKLLDQMCLCGPTLMFRRKTAEAIDFRFDEQLSGSEDYDFCLRMAEVTKLSNITEPLYYYRQHSEATSVKKRHLQMRNKAIALEQAIARRYGPEPGQEHLMLVAKDYLRAAILSCVICDMDIARDCLSHALSVFPTVLTISPLIEEVVVRYTPKQSPDAGIIFVERVFGELLPDKPHLARIKSRLQARLYMQAVFALLPDRESDQVYKYLWQGVRKDPSWLLNRGVISLLAKSMLKKSRISGS